ncbi:MAG: PEP-CTERM sorting domain-containing protein [Thiohalocapsa sp. PB-PSB1]|jgi:hypothetical protein|nr:MAG: PEP-CTERM sorting domain-containing protein [Thiohalocapsa sp. PB-PSB1]HCS89755.1 hypothetical protein [Chromatiaceae bacterium]
MNTRMLACSLGLLAMTGAPVTMAGLANGDFGSGFAGWSGETEDTISDLISVAPGGPYFTLLGEGLAELATDPTGVNTYAVELFQVFDLPGNATTLDFDWSWTLTNVSTDPFDLAQAILTNTANTLDSLLLLDATTLTGSGTSSVDISGFAGKNVELRFRVGDGGDDQSDSFSFGNIVVNQAPAPSTIALLGLGALGLRRARRQR